MSTALTETTRPNHLVLRGLYNTIHALAEDLRVIIEYAELADDVGIWDGEIRTVILDVHSDAEDQLWFLADVWWMLVVGEWIIDPRAERRPTLRLVPEPRSELSPL